MRKLVQRINWRVRTPLGYGVFAEDPAHQQSLVAVIPLNYPLRIVWMLYRRMLFTAPLFPSRMEDTLFAMADAERVLRGVEGFDARLVRVRLAHEIDRLTP